METFHYNIQITYIMHFAYRYSLTKHLSANVRNCQRDVAIVAGRVNWVNMRQVKIKVY